MKKKVISLLLAATLVLSNSAIVFAEGTDDAAATTTTVESTDTTTTEDVTTTDDTTTTTDNATTTESTTTVDNEIAPVDITEEDGTDGNTYQYEDSIDSIYADQNSLIIDIRTNEEFKQAHLTGAINVPTFEGNTPNGAIETFKKTMSEKKDNYDSYNIYLCCRAGKLGAEAGYNALKELGYDTSKIFIIKGGYNAAKGNANMVNFHYATAAEAMASYFKNPASVIDLRAQADHNNGSLLGGTYKPVFATDKALAGPEAIELQDDFAKEIRNIVDANGTVYVLCYTGNLGAQKAVEIAHTEGIDTNKVKIITGGAMQTDLFRAATEPKKYVTTAEAVKNEANATVLDLRPYSEYAISHLKGSISLPSFDLPDYSLVAKTQEWAKTADVNKPIYLLCYTGNRGAEKATIALLSANSNLKVYTIKDGRNEIAATNPKALRYVAGSTALNDKNGVIIDLRRPEDYQAGYLKGSISLPVCDSEKSVESDAAKALQKDFTAYIEAHKAELEGKKIYLLCYSGSRLANTATELLKQFGIEVTADVLGNGKTTGIAAYTIDGGAGDATIKANFITSSANDTNKPAGNKKPTDNKSKSPKTGDAAATLPLLAAMGAAVLAIVNRKKFAK